MRKVDVSELSRRSFRTAVSAAASAPLVGTANPPGLAVAGGTPVRATPLTSQFEGANSLDDKVRTRKTPDREGIVLTF